MRETKVYELIMNILGVITILSIIAMFITGVTYTYVRTTEMLNIAAIFAMLSGTGMGIGFYLEW